MVTPAAFAQSLASAKGCTSPAIADSMTPISNCDRPAKVSIPSPLNSAAVAPTSSRQDLAMTPFQPSRWSAGQQLASAQSVEVDPEIIESSPVLQRWLEEVPDVSVDIQHDPAFRTRVRVGYSQFPSTDHTSGYYLGVQDVFLGRTPLTLSAEYSANGRGDRELIGVDAQYYLLPLGWYGNVAPVVGYRAVNNDTFSSDGINVGLRIILIPSRTGAADLSLTQSWVSPGTPDEVGLTTFSAGYAVTEDVRLATDIQTQNTRERQESRVSVLVEWLP